MSPYVPKDESDDIDMTNQENLQDAIAIIGFSIDFPQADTAEKFWHLLAKGRSAAREFPSERLNHSAWHNSDGASQGYLRPKKSYLLDRDISAFDAPFFSITEVEAMAMDPQQRALLETTYRALEDAGIPISKVNGTDTSVFTGCFTADYLLLTGKDPERMPKYFATGSAASMLSNRISTFFNLTGPSMTIDTACSSSLVALDMACESLRRGNSSMGIVTGCNLIYSLDLSIGLSNMGFLSPEGICHSFDQRANGYSRGEGFGALIIKPLPAALRDGDTIRAVIRATGSNQNGYTTLAHPNKDAQISLIQKTYQRAKLDMSVTQFVEAHGTGTSAGDPIEAAAIGEAFRSSRARKPPILIGASKANIGHLEGTSGIAGVVKTILVLERGIIPPIANLEQLNPAIDDTFLNIQFPTACVPWPTEGLRRASVNSFGFGGSNAHAVLDDAYNFLDQHGLQGNHCTSISLPSSADIQSLGLLPPIFSQHNSVISDSYPQLFVWSGKDMDTTSRLLGLYQSHLESMVESRTLTNTYAISLAATLNEKRSAFPWKSFGVASGADELVEVVKTPRLSVNLKKNAQLGFVFTGQGAQWLNMGKELLIYPVFRLSVLQAQDHLQALGSSWQIMDFIESCERSVTHDINDAQFAQPLCTILQVALVELLETFNIKPSVVIGHSSGEIAAAYAAGAISRKSAWKLAYYRGSLSSGLSKQSDFSGTMISVALSQDDTLPYMARTAPQNGPEFLCVACINSPRNVTVSGDVCSVQKLSTALEKDSIFNRILTVPVAYHSPQMNGIPLEYEKAIGHLEEGSHSSLRCLMISTVTGKPISTDELLQPSYWVRNLVSPVRFADAVETSCTSKGSMTTKKIDLSHRNVVCATELLEIGPHSALQGPIREIVSNIPNAKEVVYASLLVRHKHAVRSMMHALGTMYCLGYPLNIARLNAIGGNPQQQAAVLPGLPQYPFNHAKTYWTESRISKNIRFRANGPNPFLGAPVADWNPLEPRWRHFLSASTTSSSAWIRDHKINGEILLPAAAMVVMALEAVSQISDNKTRTVIAYEVKNVNFLAALVVPLEEEGVETQICLRTQSGSLLSGSDFSICTYGNTTTLEICRGHVQAIFEDRNSVTAHEIREDGELAIAISDKVKSFLDQSPKEDSGQRLYNRLYKIGYHFGESFCRIEHLQYGESGQAVGSISAIQGQGTKPTVIHPATLDGILQMMLPAATVGGNRDVRTTVPTRINRLYIVKNILLLNAVSSSPLRAHVSLHQVNTRTTSSTIHAFDPNTGAILMTAESVEATAVTDVSPDSEDKGLSRRLCFDLQFKPDISLMNNAQIEHFLTESRPTQPDPEEEWRDISALVSGIIRKTSQEVRLSDVPPDPPHLRKHFEWITKHSIVEKEQEYSLEELNTRARKQGRLGDIYSYFGKYLNPILRGEVDALEILNKNNILRDYYDTTSETWKFISPMKAYIDLLAHKDPAMKILEVGAGTGSTTKHILEVLTTSTSHGISGMYSHYDFTDVSPQFLAKAEEEFGVYPKLRFRIFDVEEDPIAQGYEQESYDLILAANVLHATKSLDATLTLLRKLLKKDGKLILVEITEPQSPLVSIIFGCLSGWWQSTDDYRTENPCISTQQWDEVLKRNSFSGVDVLSRDYDFSHYSVSLMISTAIETRDFDNRMINIVSITPTELEQPISVAPIVNLKTQSLRIVGGFSKPFESCLAQNVRDQCGDSDTAIWTFQEAAMDPELDSHLVIVVYENWWPRLDQLSEDHFLSFQTVLVNAKALLWISATAEFPNHRPQHAMMVGFARTLRMERTGLIFTTLFLNESEDEDSQRHHICTALQNTFAGIETGIYEPEFTTPNNLIQIPRMYEDEQLNQIVHNMTEPQSQSLLWGDRDLTLRIKTPGLLESLYFAEEAPNLSSIEPDELEVEVKAVGVNFKDVLVAMGHVKDNTFGTECSGTVVRAGSKCHAKRGDRVVVCHLDAFRRTIRCKDSAVAIVPENLTFTEAASIPTNFITAYRALAYSARLEAGESVLVHAGAGGTGQAAIQVAQHLGAEVYATVSTETKKQLLMRLYRIPGQNILNSRDLSFSKAIQRLTKGRGVDVVLNSLSGASLLASWECIAPYGRFIEIGKRDILDLRNLPLAQFERNVTFSAIDIAAMATERPDLVSRNLTSVLKLFEKGALRMVDPFKTFQITQVEEAFRYLQTGKQAGKVVVEVDPSAQVEASIKSHYSWSFSEDHTYVISGGLGGQGRSIARWAASRGARHLLLLSRSGAHDTSAIRFLAEMKTMGINVQAPACDITDRDMLCTVLKEFAGSMPPVKGCFQSSAVFRDTYFNKMTYKDWNEALMPKVEGSWNLHCLLPHDMDFLIFLSSLTGIIGSQVQANYAAGNTFEDGLAHYRLSHGQNATSIDLSAMQSEGVLADHREVFDQIVNVKQLLPMSQEELFAILDQYCRPTSDRAQVITGLELPTSVVAKGAPEPAWMSQPAFSTLHQLSSTITSAAASNPNAVAQDINKLLKSAESKEQSVQVLVTTLQHKLSKYLSISKENFNVDQPLHSYGVDSLVAMELRNWFLKVLKVEVSVFEVLGGNSTNSLAATIAQKLYSV